MATFKYTIASGCDTGLMQKHSHSALISDINNSAKNNNNIPRGAVISSARVVLVMSHNGGLGSADLNVWLCNNESDNSGENLISDSTNKNNDKTYQKDISSKISKNYPFTFNTSYSRIAVYYKSTTHRHYRDRDFYVEYTYSVPTYTVTVNTGTGGTASGGGTYENQSTATLTATANKGYTFSKWSDGNTQNPRYVSVTGNATYTAEFKAIDYKVNVSCEESVSGHKCTVSGGGTYHYGDTIVLKATDIPPNHSVTAWRYDTLYSSRFYLDGSSSLSIVLNDTNFIKLLTDKEDTIDFVCILEHTGFLVRANVYPDISAGAVGYGFFMPDGFSQVGTFTSDGEIVSYADSDDFCLVPIPNAGYRFSHWEDGSTDEIRKLLVTCDTTYTAYFKLDKIFLGNRQAKAIYVGTQEVKEVYVGTTKVYES